MKRLFSLFIAFWTAVAAAPGFAFICDSPCRMTQAEKLACAKACNLAKDAQDGASLSKPACLHLEVSAAEQALPAPAPLDLALPAPAALVPEASLASPAAKRGPPEASPLQAFQSPPSSHAPPALS